MTEICLFSMLRCQIAKKIGFEQRITQIIPILLTKNIIILKEIQNWAVRYKSKETTLSWAV